MDHEFLNAYIQRMLALNSELTNKNVMLETKLVILEGRYNALVAEQEKKAAEETQPLTPSDDFSTEDN